jgi:hypothetical protein
LEEKIEKMLKRERMLQKAAEDLTEKNILLEEDNENLKRELRRITKNEKEEFQTISIKQTEFE